MTPREIFLRTLEAHGDPAGLAWLEAAIERVRHGAVSGLLSAYTAAGTRLGGARLVTLAPGLPDDVAALPPGHWTAADAGRLVLLLTRLESLADGQQAAADAVACYEQGDAGEQQSWLKGAALLPEPERFLWLMIDACRTNIVPNFEAVACENVYPARYFPAPNFNQVVLKALFNGVALARIAGLHRRANPELARMAADYAAERRVANRPVPADIALAMSATEPS